MAPQLVTYGHLRFHQNHMWLRVGGAGRMGGRSWQRPFDTSITQLFHEGLQTLLGRITLAEKFTHSLLLPFVAGIFSASDRRQNTWRIDHSAGTEKGCICCYSDARRPPGACKSRLASRTQYDTSYCRGTWLKVQWKACFPLAFMESEHTPLSLSYQFDSQPENIE